MQATITVVAPTRSISIAPVVKTIDLLRPVLNVPGLSGATVWPNPANAATKITMDADGGITIESPVRITIRNTTTGDSVIYQ
jgi:hypothetical protein